MSEFDPERMLHTFDSFLNFPSRPQRPNDVYYDLNEHASYRHDGLNWVLVAACPDERDRFVRYKLYEQCGGDVAEAIAETFKEICSPTAVIQRRAILGAEDIFLGTRLTLRKVAKAFLPYQP